jgi:hypothetical protein
MGLDPFQQSFGIKGVDDGLAAGKPVHALNRPAASVMVPSSAMTLTLGRSCRVPMSKSLGSWAGVTFSAPGAGGQVHVRVADDGDFPFHQRQDHVVADRSA